MAERTSIRGQNVQSWDPAVILLFKVFFNSSSSLDPEILQSFYGKQEQGLGHNIECIYQYSSAIYSLLQTKKLFHSERMQYRNCKNMILMLTSDNTNYHVLLLFIFYNWNLKIEVIK